MTQQSHSSPQARYWCPIRSQLKAINGEGAQALLLSPITLEQPGWQPNLPKPFPTTSLLSATRWFQDELISGHDIVIYICKIFCDPGQLLTTWWHSCMMPWQVRTTWGWWRWGRLQVFWLKNGDLGSILTVCPTSSQDHTSPTSSIA